MQIGFWDRQAATVLAPLAGGLAPAVSLWLLNGATFAVAAGGPMVWAMRDLLVSYVVALPVLLMCRRIGISGLALPWLIVALLGAPIGYVLANPTDFAWAPNADIEQGAQWGRMLGYMALFGLTGLLYAAGTKDRSVRA